ncbi:NACHT domain-containing protein [Mycolicibacterium tusciae]|nr:hypothetical protein [Mycolicibacterium tusciae]
MADIERFWYLRGNQFYLDSDGFLADPDDLILGRISGNPDAIPTSELRDSRALVMLGEMGTGKSKVLELPDRLVPPGVEVLAIDLAPYGSEDRLVNEVLRHPSIERWKANSTELALVLDGFDEAQERIPQLGQIVANAIRSWPTNRMIIRIACRSLVWSHVLEGMLEASFDDLRVVGLLPLRREDARAIAAELCDDPDSFLQEVDGARASAFASRPQTLRMLARSFQRDGTLPERAAELYDRGMRSLAEETNEGRLESGLAGSLTIDERIAVARRIAAGLTFGRSAAVWTGRQDQVGSGDLLITEIAEGTEPTLSGSVAVTEDAVRDILSTGLFASMGPRRLGFAHASFAEYLTAAWIVANGLSDNKVRALLVGPDGRARPQLRVTAAWLVAIAPGRFGWLTAVDPECFLGQVDLPTDELRAAVIDGLFMDADRRQWGFSERLDGLNHSAIADQIRPKLAGGSPDQRRLAVKLARDCKIVELLPELTGLALDPAQDDGLRTRAGYAAISIGSGAPFTDLVPLVRDDSVRGADVTDELLAVGLAASWPHAIETAEVFSMLGTPKQRNFYGGYLRFVGEFAKGLQHQDLPVAIYWLEAHLEEIDSGDFEELANAIIGLVAAADIDDDIGAVLVRIATARAENYEGLMFHRRSRQRASELLMPESRHKLVNAIIDRTTDDTVVLYLSDRPASGSGLLTADDLNWIIAEAATASGRRLDALNRVFDLTFAADRRDHVDLFLDLDDEHPIRLSRQDWVQVELESDTAAQMRRMHELINAHRRQHAPQPEDDDESVAELLERIENGDHQAFIELGRTLAMREPTQEPKVDLTTMPGWLVLDPADRERVTSAAQTYLSTRLCEPDAWLDDTSILHFAAYAGYRALTLLLRTRPTALDELSPENWTEWAPIIAAIKRTIDGPLWEDKAELLKRADAHAHPVLVEALTRSIRAAAAAGLHLFWMDEVDFLFDDDLLDLALDVINSTPGPLASGLLAVLTRKRPEAAFPLLRSQFAARDPSRRADRIAAGTLLVDHDLVGSWDLLQSEFDQDHPLALEVLGNATTVRYRQSDNLLPENVIADIYLWMRQAFDPDDDPPQPAGVHVVSPREEIGLWRDHLLATLRDRGTAAAIDALASVANALPTDASLLQIQATAMTVFSQKAWESYSIRDLVLLAQQGWSALVNTEADLQTVVVDAFAEVQRELTGANPQSHLLWDTHSRRPKSEDEISDHIRNRLVELTGGNRLVVNREVQVRRNRPSGAAERADVQVDAATDKPGPFATISLPIEVKGAWHRDLLTAMESQLVAMYMEDLHVAHGCYVVLWPDVESWDGSDSRRRVVASLDRDEVIETLAAQAQRLRDQGFFVEVVHLGIEYGRPKGS